MWNMLRKFDSAIFGTVSKYPIAPLIHSQSYKITTLETTVLYIPLYLYMHIYF